LKSCSMALVPFSVSGAAAAQDLEQRLMQVSKCAKRKTSAHRCEFAVTVVPRKSLLCRFKS
jgi:hypothetical protein